MRWALLICSFCILPFSPARANNERVLKVLTHRARLSRSDSLVLVQDGKLLYQSYAEGKDQVRQAASITKSVCALAIAVLIEGGRIPSWDTPASRWFPEWRADPLKSKITLKMILNHTSGLPNFQNHPKNSVVLKDLPTDFFKNKDLVREARRTPLIAPPGTEFVYSDIATSLLQKIIASAAGTSVTKFVASSLFAPLGIKDFSWQKDGVGHEITSRGLLLSTADLLKIGQMMLDQGKHQGHEIIHIASFRELTRKSQPFADYGLGWWLGQSGRSFFAKGHGGQYVIVVPSTKLIVVRTRDFQNFDLAEPKEKNFAELPHLAEKWM